MKCQATFKEHCQYPKCDCDRTSQKDIVSTEITPANLHLMKTRTLEQQKLEGKCHALWLLNGNETEEWNGEGCNCEYIQGNINCRLNPF